MAAPTPSSRPSAPTNKFKMPDGYQFLVVFKNSALAIWPQTAKPGGIDGGEPINTTTMFNATWRTMAARKLKTKMNLTFKAAFDPYILDPNGIGGGVQGTVNDDSETVTEFWPNGGTYCYFGYLQKYENPEFKEGEFPVADFTIVPTMWDKTNQVEAGPVYTGPAGTP